MTWWLSFSDPTKPRGFLGVIVVDADSFIDALRQTHKAKINPGGEVQGYQLNDADPATKAPRMELLDRKRVAEWGESTL